VPRPPGEVNEQSRQREIRCELTARDEMMKLGAFFHPTGNHVAAWLHPDAQIDAGTNFKHYARLAQTAERGKFDLMFLADALAVRDGNWRR